MNKLSGKSRLLKNYIFIKHNNNFINHIITLHKVYNNKYIILNLFAVESNLYLN